MVSITSWPCYPSFVRRLELRGFAPTCREPLGLELGAERLPGRAIGILEYWNYYGIMGSGKMGHCHIGKIFLDKESNK